MVPPWWLVLFVVVQVVARPQLYRMMDKAQCMARCYNQEEASQCIAAECKYHRTLQMTDWRSGVTRLPGDGPTELRLLCRTDKKLVVEWTMSTNYSQTPVFVLEFKSRLDSKWHVVGIPTPWPSQDVANLTSATEYKFQVRAVVESGQLGEPTSSDWISTLQDLHQPQQVSNVRLQPIFTAEAGKLANVVLWDPAEDRNCYYEVHVLKTSDQDVWFYIKDAILPSCPTKAEPKNKTFVCPYEFQFPVDNLLYDSDYILYVLSNSKGMEGKYRESPKANLTFRSPTCATLNPLNTTVCPPATEQTYWFRDRRKLITPGVIVPWTPQMQAPMTSYQVQKDAITTSSINGNSLMQIGSPTTERYIPGERMQSGPDSFAISVGSLSGLLIIAVFIFTLQQYLKKKGNENKNKSCEAADNRLLNELVVSRVTRWTHSEWAISPGRLMLGDKLGEGAFGVVYKGFLKMEDGGKPKEVAVKMTRGCSTDNDTREFHREIEIMKAIGSHPHVVSIIGSSSIASSLLLITEYCSMGDLQHFLRQEWDRREALSKQSRFCADAESELLKCSSLDANSDGIWSKLPLKPPSWKDVVTNQMYGLDNDEAFLKSSSQLLTANDLISFARQVALGMEFLSRNHVVHRDLAARNVLVCSNHTVKISDFGLSRDVYNQTVYCQQTNGKIPVKWMALESLLFQVYTTQSDIWSFGVLLWEIVTLGREPYPNSNVTTIITRLQLGLRLECPKHCSEPLYEIMTACWEEKPKNRPTFKELYNRLDVILTNVTSFQYLNLEVVLDNCLGYEFSFTEATTACVSSV